MKMRVSFVIDSHNYGCILRLQEDGVVSKVVSEMVEQRIDDHEAALAKAKEFRNGHSTPKVRVAGLPAHQCVITIMQRNASGQWYHDEVGAFLEQDFGFKRSTASGTLTMLERNGYVTHDTMNGSYSLTHQGRIWKQDEAMEIKRSKPEK